MRIIYSKMLDRKLIAIKDDKNALIHKLRNAVELKDFTSAFNTSHLLKRYWPKDEQTWIEVTRVCVEGKDSIRLQKTIDEIQHANIVWTEEGREQVSPWIKMATNEVSAQFFITSLAASNPDNTGLTFACCSIWSEI